MNTCTHKERLRNVEVTGFLTLDGEPIIPGPRIVGGRATVTGSGQIPTGLESITAAVVTLGQDPTLDAATVSATWSGSTLAVKVSRPTAADDATPIPATVLAAIHWQAIGG